MFTLQEVINMSLFEIAANWDNIPDATKRQLSNWWKTKEDTNQTSLRR